LISEGKQLYKIQIKQIEIFEKKFQIIQLTNVSTQIKIWHFNSEKKLLEMINACVSHEMRNPLNAIFQMILKLQNNTKELRSLIEKRHSQTRLREILCEAEQTLANQDNSA
jgi:signal transduction histidine kinase